MKRHQDSVAAEPISDQPPPYKAVPTDLDGIQVNGESINSKISESRSESAYR